MTRQTRTTPYNTGFASGGVTCKLGFLFFYSSVVLVASFVLPCLPAGREIPHCGKRQTVMGKFKNNPHPTQPQQNPVSFQSPWFFLRPSP